ncbi:unnamed protein product [Brachionus calyciflorus]|uniref:Uncharacterized protein n=1 Tax=Brachionus calyciflorus TaxID=104777 RepID=A0A813Q5R2_9BILA|nr:unnamed protein product [Brachionus calyciflorus]
MRNKKETFRIQDLIVYAECKNARYDSNHSIIILNHILSNQINGGYNQPNPGFSKANSSCNQQPGLSTQQQKQQTQRNKIMLVKRIRQQNF